MRRALPVDRTDLLSLPLFAITMAAEARLLARRASMGGSAPASPPQAPGRHDDHLGRSVPDPVGPIGYERADTRTSLTMLLGNIAVNLATMRLLDRITGRLYRRRILHLGARRGAAVGALVLWDLLYYWSHRSQHEVRLLWGNHVTHHSSERYNLSTAQRQPWSPFLVWWTYFPLPLAGFTPAQIAKAGQIDLLYQYWIHTELIDRLPAPAEAVLNTPSHHRVHHGTNPQYLDRNYGGILIVWDRIFGTFEPEVERVRYGLTKNIGTFRPLSVAYHEMAAIGRDVRRSPGIRARLRHLFGPPR